MQKNAENVDCKKNCKFFFAAFVVITETFGENLKALPLVIFQVSSKAKLLYEKSLLRAPGAVTALMKMIFSGCDLIYLLQNTQF